MKKLFLLLLMSVLFVFTGCSFLESEDNNSKNISKSDSVSENSTPKTIIGRWTNPTYYTHKHGDEKYHSDDPFSFVISIDNSQYFNIQSSLDSSVYTSGSWSKTDEDDNMEYYTVYVDGRALAEMDFDKENGSLLMKSLKNDFSVYYDSYSCKQSE